MKKFHVFTLLFTLALFLGGAALYAAGADLPESITSLIFGSGAIGGFAMAPGMRQDPGSMMSSGVPVLDKIRTDYARMGKNPRISQSTLFLRQAISATKTNYEFAVLTNDGTRQDDEIRLDLTDEFIVTGLGIYIYGKYISGAGPVVATSPSILLTFNPVQANGATMQGTGRLYDGTFQVMVDNVVYIANWDIRRHYKAPITQQGAFAAGTANATLAAASLAEDGMYPVRPSFTLSGAKKNSLSISLPSAIAGGNLSLLDDQGVAVLVTTSDIALVARGYLAQNAASYQR